MQKSRHHAVSAFTLIELAIVLVVIGLIVAGVVAGASLVKSAQSRKIASELADFKFMTNAFYLQYGQLPGDFDSAYNYWGSNCDATASNCNGDGNGIIDYTGVNADNETPRFWQHLSLAGLVNRTFTGTGLYTSCDASSCYYSATNKARYFSSVHGVSEVFRSPAISDTVPMMFSGGPPGASSWWVPAYTVPETALLDRKIDDGIANRGNFIAFSANGYGSTACSVDHNTVGGGDYSSTNMGDTATKRCVFYYILR